MVLALPGPVDQQPIKLTNIDWQVDRTELLARFQTNSLTIINDFQAAAIGALQTPVGQLAALNDAPGDDGPVVVAGAGTGLGMAWRTRRRADEMPRATEGGHLDFAPNDAQQLALYLALAERFGHVSYERILSGAGLLDCYRFVAGDAARAEAPAGISELAKQGDEAATQSVHLFVSIFGHYAGNLALAFNPTGGIYLCGGLTAHLAPWFDPALFRAAYFARGRMRPVVQKIPVYLVARHDAGLAGVRHIISNS
jgi:glucokinase